MTRVLRSLLIVALAAGHSLAQNEPRPVGPWLVVGPIVAPRPALAPESFVLADEALAATDLDRARLEPRAGDPFETAMGPRIWTASDALSLGASSEVSVAYFHTEFVVDRYAEATLELVASQRARVFLDGAEAFSKGKPDAADAKETGKASGDVSLEPGRHRLLVKSVFDPAGPKTWDHALTLTWKKGFESTHCAMGVAETRSLTVEDLLDVATIGAIQVSPLGDRVAFSMRRPEVPADFGKRWIEIRDARTLELEFTSETLGDFADFQWLPDGSGFSYIVKDGDKGSVWRRDPDGGRATRVLRDVDKLVDHRWIPGASAIVYGVTTEEKADDRGVKRMRSLVDRLPGQRNVRRLHLARADEIGHRVEIVGGEASIRLEDIRSDGRALLFTRDDSSVAQRPYRETTLYELDLETRIATRLAAHGFLTGAGYAGDRIIALGGPSLSATARAASGDTIPNDYFTRVFELDRATGEFRDLLPSLEASVEQFVWAPIANTAFLRLESGLEVTLARFDLARGELTPVPVPFDVASALSVSDDGRRLVAAGTGLGIPQRAVSLDPEEFEAGGPVFAPESRRFDRVRLGDSREFDVALKNGESIEGYVHLPVDFDPARKYPAIVFYYGGTAPIPKDFGGRYPRDLWAAHGYVVYSLTPSGATGRGGSFAARHVNDWGERTSAEILECIDAFLAAHPFVDESRLGNIGASYGGFMTLSLLTKTDRFKAAISHAGISSLASYWGEGFWGYSYSAVATAEKFPWNAREIYVDKSPLFAADKITASVLLSHGESDTNVPLGESEQMYTALKLLGKDVEFLKFSGQDHHILTYPVRKLWMKSIVAYFDWKLKDQPEWWKKLYPK